MIDPGAPIVKHGAAAREHLAGLKAAREHHRELIAGYLAGTERPPDTEPATDTDPAPT